MRTPDEIKKDLTNLSEDGCYGCFYERKCNPVDGVCLLMRESVSCIRNLEATISEMEKVDEKLAWEKRNFDSAVQMPKWISVKDRLPKRMQDVLVIVQMGDDCFYEVAALNKSLWLGLGNAYDIKCVTHWMPLPTPPKEE